MDGRFMYKRSQRLREYVASFHLFTMIIGLVVISIGAYIINSSTFSKTICIGLFVFGGVITLTSFDGFFGAYLEDTTLLMLYNIATTLYFVTEVVVIRLAYVYQTQLNHSTSKIWDFFVEQDSQFIYNIEESLSCCGYDSIDDRAIPSNKTCSVLLNTTIGCKESVLTLAHEWQKWIIVCLVTILVFQLTILLVSFTAAYMIHQDIKEEENYMSLFPSSNIQPHYAHHHRDDEEDYIRIVNNNNSNANFYRPSQRTASFASTRYGSITSPSIIGSRKNTHGLQ